MQFGMIDGIASGLYEPVAFKFGNTVLDNLEAAGRELAVEELLEMVCEPIRDDLGKLIDEGVTAPDIGYDLQDEQNEIIAEGELAWVNE